MLAGYRFGKALRFDPADVEAYKQSVAKPARPVPTVRGIREVVRLHRRAIAGGATVEELGGELPAHLYEIADTRRRNMRMPPWANGAAIRAIYAEAKRLTRETGIQHHVDHIIPLQGERVTGLHVETNLQILTGSENSRKRNRFEP